MIALSTVLVGVIGWTEFVAVKNPSLCQPAISPIPGRQHRASVVAAAHDDAGTHTIQVSDAGIEAIDTIAIVIAPIRGITAWRNVIGSSQSFASQSVKDCQKLRAIQNIAVRTAIIRFRITNYFAGAIHGAVSRLADYFRATVTIEI